MRIFCAKTQNILMTYFENELFVQTQIFQLGDDLLLALVEQQLLVVGEVFLAAVAGNESRAVVADGELGDENQDLLTVAAEDLLASYYKTHS